MRELEEALLEEEGAFHTAAAALAELDAALALAAVAADFGFVRPEVREGGKKETLCLPRPVLPCEAYPFGRKNQTHCDSEYFRLVCLYVSHCLVG